MYQWLHHNPNWHPWMDGWTYCCWWWPKFYFNFSLQHICKTIQASVDVPLDTFNVGIYDEDAGKIVLFYEGHHCSVLLDSGKVHHHSAFLSYSSPDLIITSTVPPQLPSFTILHNGTCKLKGLHYLCIAYPASSASTTFIIRDLHICLEEPMAAECFHNVLPATTSWWHLLTWLMS